MKDYVLAQLRESSTWRGAVDVVTALVLVFIMQWSALPIEMKTGMGTLAMGLFLRGSIGMLAKDTTKAGNVEKVAKALDEMKP